MRLARRALAALLALAPAAAGAQATLKFPSSLSNPAAGGYYVGPYANATFVSAVGQAKSLNVICVDFLNHVSYNDQFQVQVSSLGDPSATLAESRHPGALDTYRKAAWLGSLFATKPTTQWGSVQFAIWNLFTPAQAPDDAQSASYLALADVAASHDYAAFEYGGTQYAALDFDDAWLLTDVAAAGSPIGGHQEFIAYSGDPLTPIPEPGTLALAASGLAALGTVAARRRRKLRAG